MTAAEQALTAGHSPMCQSVAARVEPDMRIGREEIFGPVLSILPLDDIDEAIANDSEYGPGGAVWSQSLPTALRAVQGVHTGTIWVNCYGYIDPFVGFSGTRLATATKAPLRTWTPTSTPKASTCNCEEPLSAHKH
ncbi:aldehyde dehydrogenase family protein [Arthrobacter sp. OAP107]|uniref:aldehyde dehydrogenase family protein n=1 Tax=Arthrobacter sp. OAP107 TaxID=3156445 RepID=UPI0033975507